MHYNPAIQQQRLNDASDSYEKGALFETFITTLFNQKRFTLETWRKAQRITNGVYPFNMSYPDLQMVFVGKRQYRFAVECKWRKEFKGGKISWVNNYSQICIYEQFESRFRMPVFIAIGIGGTPSDPEKLYLTPLSNLGVATDVYESELIPYKRKPTHSFFYDTVQLKLF